MAGDAPQPLVESADKAPPKASQETDSRGAALDEEAWDLRTDALDPRLAAVLVEARPEEEGDEKAPRNLHNAGELFLKSGRGGCAKRLQRCVVALLDLVERRPAAHEVRGGRACVCWACGHCGLAAEDGSRDGEPPACSACGDRQTNMVQVVLADGVAVPWLEPAAEVDNEEITVDRMDERLTSFRVVPNEGEDDHPSFPHNLHNAMELFLRLKKVQEARKLKQCTDGFLQLLEEGPKAGDAVGQARVCFLCGYCGLGAETTGSKAGPCASCGEDSHTNNVDLVLPNGRQLPWVARAVNIEIAASPRTSETEAAQADAADGGPRRSARVKPNEPCPCGSGKKAKKCCHSAA